jgi:predicted alpha/beta superfamily hydrolase
MKYIASLLLLINIVVELQAQHKYPEVTIPGSHTRYITSSIVAGQEYELQILLPSGYEGSTKKYPVVYLMDSQWDFPLVKCIYGEQYYDGFIPEIIVVGVTWGGGKVLRTRDYTPPMSSTQSGEVGGADKFLDFMKTELFPFIESNYRAESDNRTLMGCSLGGLLTLYALFTHTDMFTGYAAASPALGWGNGVLNKLEETFSKKQLTKPVRVYMTVGDVETGRQYFEKFADSMKNRSYKQVRLHTKVLENTGHSGTKSETYSRGLQFVFERNQLKLSDEVLNKYVGTYQFGKENIEVQVKNVNGRLTIYFAQNVIPLFANTENHFYSTSSFLNVYFKDDKNLIDGFEVVTFDEKISVKKVK